MIFERDIELIARKERLGWTNREVGNALGISPGNASSKLNGFLIFHDAEKKRLITAMEQAEKINQKPKGGTL